MPASMTTVDALLKEVYALRLEDQLQSETVLTKRLERSSAGVVETVGGKYVDFPIRVSRNSGIGYRNENEQLQAAGQQGYAEVHVGLKYGYGRVRFTGQLMQLADKNYQAFASAMDNEMEYLKDDLAKDENFIAHGDGTGLRATINDTATSATHAVLNAQYLEAGMVVDVLLKAAGGAVAGGAGLTIVSVSGLNVTFSGSFIGATTQGVYRAGDYGREPTGFGAILDPVKPLHGLDPAVQPKWTPVRNSNAGTPRALAEGLMITECDAIRVQGGKTSVIVTSLGVRRAYFNLLTQQRRYTDTKTFTGGFQGLPFNYGTEIPLVEDVDAPPTIMKFLEEDKVKIFRNKGWHWADDDGTTIKWVSDFDAWQALMRQYSEYGVTQRNAQGDILDIIEG